MSARSGLDRGALHDRRTHAELHPRPPRSIQPARASAYAVVGAAITCAFVGTSCAGWQRWPWRSTQRFPEPMVSASDPLPRGVADELKPGPEEVLVVRHADLVRVRPADISASYPLTFYGKSIRLRAGSSVDSDAGGRAEVLWSNGNALVLSGRSAGSVGSQSRGESAFRFHEIERIEIRFSSEEQIELLGGARLSCASGPVIVERRRLDVMRVKNEAKSAARIEYLEESITLDPGQAVELPLLSGGTKPLQSHPGFTDLAGPGFQVRYAGAVEVRESRDAATLGVALRALSSDHVIRALGVEVRLAQGEGVEFQSLGGAVPATPGGTGP